MSKLYFSDFDDFKDRWEEEHREVFSKLSVEEFCLLPYDRMIMEDYDIFKEKSQQVVEQKLSINLEGGDIPPPTTSSCVSQPEALCKKKKRPFKERVLHAEKNLQDLETAEQLSELYHVHLDEVIRIKEAITAVCELHTIVGFPEPRSQQWVRKHRRTLTDAKFLLYSRINHLINKTIHLFLNLISKNGEGSWVKILKWKFATYFSHIRNEDLPPKPELEYPDGDNQIWSPHCLLGGVYDDFVRSLQKRDPAMFMRFVDSSQQLKKAMPDVPESMVKAAVIDTRKELTGVPRPSEEGVYILDEFREVTPGCKALYPEVVKDVCKDKIVNALRRTVSELFGGKFISPKDYFEPFFPSTSANYIWSRGKLGALAEIYDRFPFGKLGNGLDFGVDTCKVFGIKSKLYGIEGLEELRQHKKMEDLLGEVLTEDIPVLMVDDSRLRKIWKEELLEIFKAAKFEEPLVEAVGLPEPLKVRVISKGPPLLYTCLKPLQRWMWRTLKVHDVFALISREVSEDDIDDILGTLEEWEIALSGDYVSSTNRLHGWVTETILDQLMIEIGEAMPKEVLKEFPVGFLENLKQLMLKALTRHIFVEDGIHYPQTEGQLMGSIVSFPILNIANAALCRLSIEEADPKGRKFRLTNHAYHKSGNIAPLRVNGDDCLLRGHKTRLRKSWEVNTAYAGLSSSVGKTYFSNLFCTINSRIYEFDITTERWVEQKYVNLGLMMGRKEAGERKGRSAQYGAHQLGEISRQLKATCPEELWPVVKKRFIKYNSKELNRYPGLPWFLPEWLGGLGLVLDHDDELSLLDRKCATLIRSKMNRDRHLKPVKPKDAPMWLMHKRVQKDLSEYSYLGEPSFIAGLTPEGIYFGLEDEYAKLYKMMTINLLLKEPLSNLTQLVDEDYSVHKSMQHNVRLFELARKVVGSNFGCYEAMVNENLVLENKGLVLPCFVQSFREKLFSNHELDESL